MGQVVKDAAKWETIIRNRVALRVLAAQLGCTPADGKPADIVRRVCDELVADVHRHP